MVNREQFVAEIAEQVITQLRARQQQPQPAAPVAKKAALGDGVFPTVDEAVKAASEAQKRVAEMSLEDRGVMIDIIRRICDEQAEELGRIEHAESRIGRLQHKIDKLKAIKHVLGVEAMRIDARSDSSGLCVIDRAPWGVIGMILPATHSAPTLASNAINILAAGNTAVFSPHPAAAKVAAHVLQLFNREIEKATGARNVITTVAEASIRSAEEVFRHEGIALLCVTGGPAVVKAAAKSGKRVIAAGPGNPPVVVDETADLDQAAKNTIEGAAFDNNLLCLGEKEVFVVASVADAFVAAMKRAGAVQLDNAAIDRLTQAVFRFDGKGVGCGHAHLKRDLVGQDASELAKAAGVTVPAGTELLFGETSEDHPFVYEEQMMPFLPIVRCPDVDACIAAALKAERGYRHTAMIHSRNVDNVTKMARIMNTTLFVHNAPSMASLGVGGAGYLSFSIATPTGEGVTTPLTFTRERQIAVVGALRIV